jgi:hypothetical protein
MAGGGHGPGGELLRPWVVGEDERLVIPFEYVADGYLTHGYATTIHKAQGATVDRCFVLVDETASREHTYTAVSRGRHGNDLFVVAADGRSEERHAAEVQPDPLDSLRAAVRRSSAQRFALYELEAGSTPQLDQLRRERDLLRARLGHGPPNPSRDVRSVPRSVGGSSTTETAPVGVVTWP